MANAPKKLKTGIAVTGTASVNADEITTNTAAQTLTNKSIDGSSNTITNIPATALPSNIDAANLADGSVSNTEFQYLDGVTSDIQTQLGNKIDSSEKGAASGVATLDAGSKIPSSQLPAIAITEVFVAADITARDALTVGSGSGEVQEGDVVKVTDASADPLITSGAAAYIYDGAAYVLLKAGDEVLSVNGNTGIVSLDTDDISEGANLYHTTERAQDAAGAMATDSSKVSLTYNDGANTLTPDIVAGSLVNADINAAAAIAATKIGNGDVDNTELSYVNGVTSAIQTQLDAKLDDAQLIDDDSFATATATNIPSAESTKAYVDAQVSTGSANKTLSNLDSGVAINQHFDPDSDNARRLGDPSARWKEAQIAGFVSLTQKTGANVNNELLLNANDGALAPGAGIKFRSDSEDFNIFSQAIGAVAGPGINLFSRDIGNFDSGAVQVYSGDGVSTAGNTGDVTLESGALTNAGNTGTTGTITIRTGTTTGGTRGTIILDGGEIDASTSKITNVVDPTSDQDAATKKYVDDSVAGAGTASAGDISETSFAAAQTQTDQDITGLAFANGTVRSFKVLMSVLVDATADLYESVELLGIQKGASWDMTVESAGDNSEFTFDITAAGQVQYSSGTYAGFASATVKFRAITTSV